MTMPVRARVLLLGVSLIVAALVVWRLVATHPDDPAGGDAPAAMQPDAELERVRAQIEAERAEAAVAERAAERIARIGIDFSHAVHRQLDCLDCHSVADTHGALAVTGLRQCRECHHAPPLAANCSGCHQAGDFVGERQRILQTFAPVVREPVARELFFAHAQHHTVACASCHVEPLTMAVTGTCRDCHEQHHQPQVQCMACHIVPPRDAHTAAAHLTCTAAGCHVTLAAPLARVPRTRPFCLACHQELVDHERGGNCADCHILPPPRAAGAGQLGP
jgi:hypothetical protein